MRARVSDSLRQGRVPPRWGGTRGIRLEGLLGVAEVVDGASVAASGLHHVEVERIPGQGVGQHGTCGVEGVERVTTRSGKGRAAIGGRVVEDRLQGRVDDERRAIPNGIHGRVERVRPCDPGQCPRGVGGVAPEAGRAPGSLVEWPAPMADDQLSVLRLAVVGADDMSGQRTRAVPATDVLKRSVA